MQSKLLEYKSGPIHWIKPVIKTIQECVLSPNSSLLQSSFLTYWRWETSISYTLTSSCSCWLAVQAHLHQPLGSRTAVTSQKAFEVDFIIQIHEMTSQPKWTVNGPSSDMACFTFPWPAHYLNATCEQLSHCSLFYGIILPCYRFLNTFCRSSVKLEGWAVDLHN